MATINYRIRGKKEIAEIRMRFRDSKIEFEKITGLKVQRAHWSPKEQRVYRKAHIPYSDLINTKLNNLEAFVFEEFFRESANDNHFDESWLEDKILIFFDKSISKERDADIYFVAFVKKYIEDSRSKFNRITGKKLSERTIQSYITTCLKIEEFESHSKLRLKLKDINLKFHHSFISFLIEEFSLNPNTIGGYIDNIKMFCKNLELRGRKMSPDIQSKNFYSPKNKTNDIYLNEDEIKNLLNLDLSNSERLCNARDWLIIGVWTGLRVSDLLSLSKNKIEDDNNIHVTTFKTNTLVIIPLHSQVKKILERRGGEFPKIISDQKFNIYIKEVCSLAGINKITEGSKVTALDINGKNVYRKTNGRFPKYELVSSHICRRSFATNLYGKIDTYTIMQITGHKSERQFLEYIKTTSTEHAQKLQELWNKSDI